jgi:hypothetical protein
MGANNNFGVTFNLGSELYTRGQDVTLVDANGIGMPSITEIEGGTLSSTVSLVVNNGRTIRGFGDVNTPLLTVNGSLRPGDADKIQLGWLDVNGNLDVDVNAGTFLHIAGDPVIPAGPGLQPFDVITANAVTLDGHLEARLLNGYSPAVGTTFGVIDGTSLTGEFASAALQRPGPGKNWLIVYNDVADRVDLVVNTCVGDISYDGTIDADDLIVVILTWGQCAEPILCPGDTNGNGQVDADDLIAVVLGWGDCP